VTGVPHVKACDEGAVGGRGLAPVGMLSRRSPVRCAIGGRLFRVWFRTAR
jgi:hypothetical protein